MKKTIALFFALIAAGAYAQETNRSDTLQSGYVKYAYKGYTSPFTTTLTDFSAFLNFNSNESVFVTGRFGMAEKHNTGELMADENAIAVTGPSSSEKGQMIYRNFLTKEIAYNEFKLAGFPPYVVKDNWVEMKWELLDKTKVIAGYTAKKAETTFRGTKYTVWYTDSIALPYGPLKLFGLPGIILESTTHDVNNRDVTFTAYEVCYPCKNNQKVEAPVEEMVKTIEEEVLFRDNFQYYFVTESNKKMKTFGKMYLSELPSERKVYEKRKMRGERVYEWETKDTKRVLPGIDYKSLLDPNRNQKKPVPDYQFNKY